MGKAEFLKGIKMIESFYHTEFNQEDLKLWYGALKKIPYEIYIKAIGELVRVSKYLPTIAEILKQCELAKMDDRMKIIEGMKKSGYFKSDTEYIKSLEWIEKGIIPKWFEEDMKKFVSKQKLLVSKNTEGLEELEGVLEEFK